jgi:integrase
MAAEGAGGAARVPAQIRDCRWKDLRHTFASWVRQQKQSIQDIANLPGHTTERMTQRYSTSRRDI